MSRAAVAVLVVLALSHVCSECDAGVLGFLSDKTEQLKNDTRVVIVEAEKRIQGLFGRGNKEPVNTVLPETATSTKSSEMADEEMATTTVAPRELLPIIPRCGGYEEWDTASESCVPSLR